MPNHISFPSIDQFRTVIKYITESCKHHQVVLPTLNFTGTVKLHGTNHGVCRAPDGEIYTQSRENITTLEKDNAGSHVWTMQNYARFDALFCQIAQYYIVQPDETIQVFGEWCGGSIQKGVGLNHLPKDFVVFDVRISKDSESQEFLDEPTMRIFCQNVGLNHILNYPAWYVDVDFNCPEKAQAKLVEVTENIEKDCPVARQVLGADFKEELIGEGAVYFAKYKGIKLRFKVKGEKHSSSKVKTLAPVDVEKMSNIREFVASVVTESRLNQGLEHVTSREPKYTGDFLRWVMSNIYKEESDTMVANGFTSKEVSGPMSTAIRQWFLGVQ